MHRAAAVGEFLGGAAVGLAAHESGHLLFDGVFDADPGIKKVDFHGIPFFAITHRDDLSPQRELIVSSAGFWVQQADNEWLLTAAQPAPRARAVHERDVRVQRRCASVAYAGAAFAQTGPAERDTRGMAAPLASTEPWIGAMILVPAVLDSWRYFDPDARWAVWASRAAKVGVVLLVFK